MKTTDHEIKPGESFKSAMADALGIENENLLGVLPVARYVSACSREGIVIAFAAEDSGMAVVIHYESISELIKTLQAALEDAKQ